VATTRPSTLSELRMLVAPHDEVMRADRAVAELFCPLEDVGPCRAQVEIRTAGTPKGARKPRILLRRTVVVPVGEHHVMRLRLARDAMRFIRTRRSTPVKMTATRSFGRAGKVTGIARFSLRAPRAVRR
jgi:hypothetical protein